MQDVWELFCDLPANKIRSACKTALPSHLPKCSLQVLGFSSPASLYLASDTVGCSTQPVEVLNYFERALYFRDE